MDNEDTMLPDFGPTTDPQRTLPCLVVISGKTLGRKYLLDQKQILVGRGESVQISLDEKTVSRNHAEFYRKNNQFMVKDLQSKNGIFVNNIKVIGSALKDGDLIRIGGTVFKFVGGGKMEGQYYQA
ncbi:MAG TPA: FHA domain-containing protein [Candidatus Manganitrophaceae bacterium]|nr:FHA domain-containing protein [Candidatus Manganitrophaceae bacterium]